MPAPRTSPKTALSPLLTNRSRQSARQQRATWLNALQQADCSDIQTMDAFRLGNSRHAVLVMAKRVFNVDENQTGRSAPQRLIPRFANASVIRSISVPLRLRDSLNETLDGASKLRGVNRNRGGNLVLCMQSSYTAVQLREHEQRIWDVARPHLSLLERDRPRFHLDKPWQRVVIPRVLVNTTSRDLSDAHAPEPRHRVPVPSGRGIPLRVALPRFDVRPKKGLVLRGVHRVCLV
ncbi:hypothetical protein MSAN_00421700 [Mycena sanguinolenta]|uniref:Uncharacterized protein n=1 Tax=Mycena sanguinolenta TaxID=230812 RepID=A0A8H6ZA86_9AGAR|nr:hypothetical protein MSAN_00421700 [Mycena sanguinolenta]